MRQSRCRSCGAPIIWAIEAKRFNTKDERPMPLEADRVNVGVRFEVHEQPDGRLLAAQVTEGYGHRSHFVTCPYAEEHRRPRSEKQMELF